MCSKIIVRDGALNDAKYVQSIASPIMRSYGLEPDFIKLDFELGHFGESYLGSIAQLVACLNGVVIGSVILKAFERNSIKLTGFYISKDHQGNGAGRKLLATAIERAKLTKHDAIYLETWDKMEAATSLYTKLGWKMIADPHPDSGAERAYCLNLNN